MKAPLHLLTLKNGKKYDYFIKKYKFEKSANILDIGCGTELLIPF